MSVAGKPGYKETALGWIPENWDFTQLASVADVNPGRTKPLSDADDVSFLTMGDVSEDGRVISRQVRLYQDVAKGFTSFIDGDVLVAKITPCFENGKGALVSSLLGGIGFGSTEFHVIRAFPDSAVPTFLHLHTRTDVFRRLGGKNMVGSAGQKRVPTEFLRQYPIAIPPLPEQQKIASILTTVEEKLDVISHQIEANQALKQGLMQTLFSRGVGTQDATGHWLPHNEFKESELGEIPGGWLITTLGDICNGALQTGPFGSQLHAAEYQDEGVPVLMPKDLLKCRANLSTAARIAPERAEELAKHKLVAGDLLFSRRGDVARFALIDEQSAGALCGTGCLKAKPSEGYSSAYIAHLLQLDVVRAWLEQNAVGQTMPNMNTGILASLPLVTPANKQEQEEIAGILDSVDAKASLLFSKRLHYQTLKRGLMQKLLTGEWRVKLNSPSGSA